MKTKQNEVKVTRSGTVYECGKAVVDYVNDKFIEVSMTNCSAALSLNEQSALDLYRALDRMFSESY